MPAKTAKQQKFMAICAHSPSKARGKCPPHAVAEEFSHKVSRGGSSHPSNKGTGHGTIQHL